MNKSFAQIDQLNPNGSYLKLLSAVSKLSGLFSESPIPLIHYRVAENIFCRSFNAENLSRSDTAFDAKYAQTGVGLKTFTCKSSSSLEKVAEFNSLSQYLSQFEEKELAFELAQCRNERISLAKRTYSINDGLYHIVARRENELLLFETDYDEIDINGIKVVKSDAKSLAFEDGKNFYSYNFSKSTLFRRFYVPDAVDKLSVSILDDPYELLLNLFNSNEITRLLSTKSVISSDYVILPLYSPRLNIVPEKSGLNQWNAGGRKRDLGEIYIPIPMAVHDKCRDFFPSRDTHFNLQIPTKEVFIAKVCQDNSKALMTDPNKAMSDWLLRTVLDLKEGELLTMEKLNSLGIDSVIVTKVNDENYSIDVMKTGSYDEFINE